MGVGDLYCDAALFNYTGDPHCVSPYLNVGTRGKERGGGAGREHVERAEATQSRQHMWAKLLESEEAKLRMSEGVAGGAEGGG